MTIYKYQTEDFMDVIEEMKPLIEKHYEEVCWYKDKIALNPAYDIYEVMNRVGNCHVFTTRTEDGELVGYCISFIQRNPHYQDHIYAVNDVIYVAEEHRHTGCAAEMLKQLESIFKDMGVSVMTFHMKTFKTFETLMDSLGFEKQEFLFGKYIKEE